MEIKNLLDQAGRYLIRLEPTSFLEWALGLPNDRPYFRSWLDTRSSPFPGEPDKVRDTVARLEALEQGGEPWALVTEVQRIQIRLSLAALQFTAAIFGSMKDLMRKRGVGIGLPV